MQTGAEGMAPGHQGLAGRLPGWGQGHVKLVASHVCRLRPVVAGASQDCRLEQHVAPWGARTSPGLAQRGSRVEPDCVSCPRLGSHRISLLPCAPRVCQVSCPARGRGPSPRGTEQASRREESRSCGAVCGTHISPRAPEPAQAAGGHCPHPHSGSGHHLGTVRLMAGRTGQTLLEGPGPPPSGSETLVLPARSHPDPKCPG